MLKIRGLRYICCLMLLLGWGTGSQSVEGQMQAGAPATITLRVVDYYGKPLNYKVESFYAKDQPGVNLAQQFEGLTFKHAVQGKMYEFRLVPVSPNSEYSAFKQWIAVGEASTLAVFSVPKDIRSPDQEGPRPVTRFVIKPAPRLTDLWINVRPAFAPDISGTDLSETAVVNAEDGTFKLHGTHGGLYIVILYQGSHCRPN